jgi:hypothetical protein
MSLPIIASPKYTIEIPSTGTAAEYRPFLVKEEKVLLIAQESQDQGQIMNAIKDVIRACTYNKVDVDNLTSYDLEYLFIKLRSKSVGEISTVGLKCTECDSQNEIDINLDEIKVMGSAPDGRVQLTDTVGVNMKPMSVKDMSKIASKKDMSTADQMTESVIACIDSIYDENKVYPKTSYSRSDMETFVNSLARLQMQKIEAFITNLPKVEHTIKFKCSKCSCENEQSLSGIRSFFS